ncbi:MAG: phosphate signaling complex protein PhoU [Candidatus Limnocylindrales bacterium]
MTDPTGRPIPRPTSPSPAGREAQGTSTDLDVRPTVEIPRPFVREVLESEESEIKDAILRMGSLVAERIGAAVTALERHDADGALDVITGDEDINRLQQEISAKIITTIATQQPVARDLRFLLTLDHLAYDLERMGDHASSVAKQARKLAPQAPIKDYVHLPDLGRMVANQVRDVLAAVVEVDIDRAQTVARRDDEVDSLYHRIFAETLDLMRADPANVDPGERIIFAAHYLERVGDRVCNIAEYLVFLETGEMEDLNP